MAKIKATANGSRQDVIIKKAAFLFRKKGFRAASMRELAENMGVEAPSLYNHIGSKGELLQSICFKIAELFMKQLEEVETRQVSIVEKLEQLIRFHIRLMLQLYDKVYVANHEWKYLDEISLSQFLAQRKLYEAKMIQLVKKGIRQNEIKNIHPQVAVLTILSAVKGLEILQKHKKEIGEAELENSIAEYLVKGLIK